MSRKSSLDQMSNAGADRSSTVNTEDEVNTEDTAITEETVNTENTIAHRVLEYQKSVDILTNATTVALGEITSEIARVNAEMAALEKQRLDLRVEVERVETKYRSDASARARLLSVALRDSLANQSENVGKRFGANSNGHALALRKEAIFAAKPNLAKKYGRYRKMAETLQEKLAEFEELDEYAKALLDTHEALQEDVREILEIDEAIGSIQTPESELRIELLYSAEQDEVHIVVPAYQGNTMRDAVDVTMESLWQESVFDAFMAAEMPMTEFAEERTGPYVAVRIQMAAGWDSPEALHLVAEQMRLILNARAGSDIRVFASFVQVPEWALSSLTDSEWQNSTERNKVEERAVEAPPIDSIAAQEAHEMEVTEGRAAEETDEESDFVAEPGEGWVNPWIRHSDLREWRRKAPGASGSKWTPHARRIRTVLMRMVGRGAISAGGSALTFAPFTALLDGLPKAAHIDLRMGIQQLLANGVLLSQNLEDAQMLAIASDRLEMVGDLINRDVTPEWEEVFLSAL